MRKSFKFKLYQNKKKGQRLSNELWQFHLIYNHALRLVKKHYKIFGKNPSKNDLQKHLKRLMDRGLRSEWKALGGKSIEANISVLCRQCNLRAGVKIFGVEKMNSRRRENPRAQQGGKSFLLVK